MMSMPQLVALVLIVVSAIALAIFVIRHRRKSSELQAMPVFDTFSAEVGRVAEEGAAIHVALGSGGLLEETGMVSVAALQGLTGLTGLAAAYDTPPLVTVGDPTLYLLADNQLRRAYGKLGAAQRYPATSVQFLAPHPVLYAAMAATTTLDQPIATNINLGAFDQEVSLLTHAALAKRAKIFGGAVSTEGVAALYPVVPADRLIMGEQMFAGGAEVTDRAALWGSLGVQNLLRWLVIIGILLAAGASLIGD